MASRFAARRREVLRSFVMPNISESLKTHSLRPSTDSTTPSFSPAPQACTSVMEPGRGSSASRSTAWALTPSSPITSSILFEADETTTTRLPSIARDSASSTNELRLPRKSGGDETGSA